MNTPQRPYNEIDDYIATLSPEEQREVALAEAALDLAYILYEARQELGYSIDITVTDAVTGRVVGQITLHNEQAP